MNPLREKSAFSFPPLTAQTGIKRTSHFTARTDNHWLGITNVVFITFLNEQSWWQRTSKDVKWDYSIGGEERKKKEWKKERMKERKELWVEDFPESMTHEWSASQRCHKLAELLKLAYKLMSNWFLLNLQIFISRVFIRMYILNPKIECWVILSG